MSQAERLPLISIILLGWKRLAFLREAIDSIIAQDYPSWELIFIDQGNLAHYCTELHQLAHHVEICRNTFDTPAAAGTAGIQRARGQYITFLDDDNKKDPQFLSKMINFATKQESPIVVCESQIFGIHDGEGLCPSLWAPKPPVISLNLLRYDNYIDWGEILIQSDFLHAIGGIDTTLMGLQDWDLAIRCARALDVRGGIPVLSEPLHYYRVHAQQLTFRPDMQNTWQMLRTKIQQKYFYRV
jgi:glycosyltransferase involved in cell wall biosynthesis